MVPVSCCDTKKRKKERRRKEGRRKKGRKEENIVEQW